MICASTSAREEGRRRVAHIFDDQSRPPRRFAARIAMQQQPRMWTDSTEPSSARSPAMPADDGPRALAPRQRPWAVGAGPALGHTISSTDPPTDRFYDMLLLLAGDAAQARQWDTAYNIARQLDDTVPASTDVSQMSYATYATITHRSPGRGASPSIGSGVRQARSRCSTATPAPANRCRCEQGKLLAGRAALSAGRVQEANSYFERAAAYPELFYGQLALERLGRSVTPPPASSTQYTTTPMQRSAFGTRRLVQAVRMLQQGGSAQERSWFTRALAESLDNDTDRRLAVDFAQQVGRRTLPFGSARRAQPGLDVLCPPAFPAVDVGVRTAVVAGARDHPAGKLVRSLCGKSPAPAEMMQLMPGTAREQAGKMGVGYDGYRDQDPGYNVMLGSAYFQRMLNMWDGNVPSPSPATTPATATCANG